MKIHQFAFAALSVAATSACAIRQEAMPVMLTAGEDICVVHNAAVRNTVEPVIIDALQQKGFSPRVVQAPVDASCTNKLEYTAKWSWDITTYMSKANLSFYQAGTKTGEAVYDSKTAGGLNMSKWVNAEEKLREMVDELFPAK
jgi:hypothetical protein